MARLPTSALAVIAMLLLAACASRPVNPPIAHADQSTGYRFFTRPQYAADNENLVILAFSGGGTRAAACSYGVLEFLRNTEVVGPKGTRSRLLDHVSVAPVRGYIDELLPDVRSGAIRPGRVFDLVLPLSEAAEAYAAMDERRATKVLLRP